ncbi:MAG TPA: hypothetical protein VEE85_01115 [Candidatus Bathyarchaeia archaeon]|nr:hypothetical protein [Candidatus Bathyarchaeia archaeon]
MSLLRQPQCIEISGYSVPLGARGIHFYYTKPEQQRLLGFLLEGIARYEGVVLACAGEVSESLSDGLEMLGVRRSQPEITRVEITSNVRASMASIAAAARNSLGGERGSCCRVLCDFGSMIGQEAVFEVESVLHSFLSGLNLVSVTQYDGRGFGAPITMEQFQTHALAIVGSAFFCGNRYCAPLLPFVPKPAMRRRK